MWKSPAVSGSIKRICAAAPAWKFSESRAVLSAYEMGAPKVRVALLVLSYEYESTFVRKYFRKYESTFV